jgi:dodecin
MDQAAQPERGTTKCFSRPKKPMLGADEELPALYNL